MFGIKLFSVCFLFTESRLITGSKYHLSTFKLLSAKSKKERCTSVTWTPWIYQDGQICVFQTYRMPRLQGCSNSLQHYKMEYFLRLNRCSEVWVWFGEGLSVCFLIMCSLFMIWQGNLIRKYPVNNFIIVEFLRS